MKRLRLLFATLPLTLCACAGMGAATLPGPQSYTLKPGQQLDLGSDTKLIYDSVSDSRCPARVQCIWAGEVLYHFRLATPATTMPFTLGPGKATFVTQVAGSQVALDTAKIPPPQQPGAALAPHPVTLVVSRP